MKFKFIETPTQPNKAFPNRKYFLRPIIPIRIINPLDLSMFYSLEATIDSGSDYSMFPLDIAIKIGIPNYDNNKVTKFEPIGGESFLGFFRDVILDIRERKFNTFVCFTEKKLNWPVLGCNGFFNLFEVTLDYSKKIIELKPNR